MEQSHQNTCEVWSEDMLNLMGQKDVLLDEDRSALGISRNHPSRT